MAVDETGEDPHSPKDARLSSLDARLDRIKAGKQADDRRRVSAESQRVIKSAGMRILSVLVGYPLGGFLIGWVLDQWLDTFPWFSLGSMFLGFGLAFREVWRSANQRPEAGNGD